MNATVSVTSSDVELPMIMFREDLSSAFQKVSEIGYQGIELFLDTAEDVKADDLKGLLKKHQLKVGMLAAMADLIKADIVMGHPEAAIRKTFIKKAPVHLELASALEARVPIGFTRGYIRPGTTKEDMDEWFMETLEKYAKIANDLGVTLVLEPINRHEINYINRTDEALKIVEALNLPNLKLLLDSYHMNIEEVSIPRAVLEAGKHIGHFHFVDSNRWPPGYGHTDMKEIYLCLRQVDYRGFLGVEALPKPDPVTGARWGLDYIHMLDRLWEELYSISASNNRPR